MGESDLDAHEKEFSHKKSGAAMDLGACGGKSSDDNLNDAVQALVGAVAKIDNMAYEMKIMSDRLTKLEGDQASDKDKIKPKSKGKSKSERVEEEKER